MVIQDFSPAPHRHSRMLSGNDDRIVQMDSHLLPGASNLERQSESTSEDDKKKAENGRRGPTSNQEPVGRVELRNATPVDVLRFEAQRNLLATRSQSQTVWLRLWYSSTRKLGTKTGRSLQRLNPSRSYGERSANQQRSYVARPCAALFRSFLIPNRTTLQLSARRDHPEKIKFDKLEQMF